MAKQHTNKYGSNSGCVGESPSNASPEPHQNVLFTEKVKAKARGYRFWLVFLPLVLSPFLVALEATVLSTALPIITRDLNSTGQYVWFVNAYLLTCTIFNPFYGQLASISGRKWPSMIAISLFSIGSGISGGATSTNMLIAGRLVQGTGGAGLSTMSSIILSDLVSVRERAKFQSVLLVTAAIGGAIGPFIGGLIALHGQWRWLFWMNLPFGGVMLLMQYCFLHMPRTTQDNSTLLQKLKQIDWIGSMLLSASAIAILLALSWADASYPWSSWQILVPLLIGFVGMVCFHIYESSPLCLVPTIPGQLFTNLTAAVGLINTFISSMVWYWRIYFLAAYFQVVRLAPPTISGLLLLPTVIVAAVAGIVAGLSLSHWGRYKPIHILAYSLLALGTGLYANLDTTSSLAEIIIYQIFGSIGAGFLMTSLLPAVQAAMPPSDLAVVCSTWIYIRTFGGIWGIAIPAAIFNNRLLASLSKMGEEFLETIGGRGNASTQLANINMLVVAQDTRKEVIAAYLDAMSCVWFVCLAFCILALFLSCLEKEIALRTIVESDYRLGKGGTRPGSRLESAK